MCSVRMVQVHTQGMCTVVLTLGMCTVRMDLVHTLGTCTVRMISGIHTRYVYSEKNGRVHTLGMCTVRMDLKKSTS